MRITPLDARKQEFSKSMRGFDCDEVRAFLNTLADEYEAVLVDNKQIRERVLEQDGKIADYQKMEKTLRDTLMTAERVMQETRENATREGDVIVQEAQLKAKGIMEECRLRTEELRREIRGLRQEKENYLARFRGLAEAQIKFVDNHQSDFEDLDKRLVDIVDSVVADTTRPVQISGTSVAAAPGVAPATGPAATETAVAPAPTAAPVTGEQDIWRDYNPVAKQASPIQAVPPHETPAPEAPAAPSPHAAAVATPAVGRDRSGTEPGHESGHESGTKFGNEFGNEAGNIADLVSESLAEADNTTDSGFRPPVEPLEIDVISNGQDETEDVEEPMHHNL